MQRTGPAENAPMPADPRPEFVKEGERYLLVGGRCRSCGLASAYVPPICACGQAGQVESCGFGPGGTVFSSTVLHIPVPGRPPPTCLAYVDVDDGPRILAHVELGLGVAPLPGDQVFLAGRNSLGDPVVKPDQKTGLVGSGADDE